MIECFKQWGRYSRDFKQKLKTFQASLNKPAGRAQLHVSRNDLFHSSYQSVMQCTSAELQKNPYIVFDGESGTFLSTLCKHLGLLPPPHTPLCLSRSTVEVVNTVQSL